MPDAACLHVAPMPGWAVRHSIPNARTLTGRWRLALRGSSSSHWVSADWVSADVSVLHAMPPRVRAGTGTCPQRRWSDRRCVWSRRPRGSTPRVSPWTVHAAGDKVQLTEVEVGLRTPGEVEMKTGLSEADVVVTEGQTRLRDGGVIAAVGPEKG